MKHDDDFKKIEMMKAYLCCSQGTINKLQIIYCHTYSGRNNIYYSDNFKLASWIYLYVYKATIIIMIIIDISLIWDSDKGD